ncbi:head-tail connector protein [Roseinatronobacter alkalisoli]|uniref:Head-tail connector protein n=1 Tax=Roseinatronobacter alkalisoli TaxID=3028235 RepID=A0ABT5T8L4_9RHOB|nr:head-tail connector protein [Roseinatronobacter sp. HJB301]MDD7971331.1 head-tail connector protein [Roseinatronobacter sp. HJB301]
MDLQATSPIPLSALPLAAFRDHLRLSSGFADAVTEDALLEQYLRAALDAVEGRVSRALLLRDYTLRLTRWRDDYAQTLPRAPVAQVTALVLIDRLGAQSVVPPDRYILQADGARPRIIAAGSALPAIPSRGAVEITFAAGFGAAWEDIPADLRQAVLLLAAQYYEHRDTGPAPDMDFGIRALLERWRDIRLGGRA